MAQKNFKLRMGLVVFAFLVIANGMRSGLDQSSFQNELIGYTATVYMFVFLFLFSTRRRGHIFKGELSDHIRDYHAFAIGWFYLGKYIKKMSAKEFLDLHILTSLLALLMVFFHSAMSFNGLPGITARVMAVVAISGMSGRYILKQLRKMKHLLSQLEEEHRETTEVRVVQMGVQSGEKFMGAWRNMHVPLTNIFFILVIYHVMYTFYY